MRVLLLAIAALAGGCLDGRASPQRPLKRSVGAEGRSAPSCQAIPCELPELPCPPKVHSQSRVRGRVLANGNPVRARVTVFERGPDGRPAVCLARGASDGTGGFDIPTPEGLADRDTAALVEAAEGQRVVPLATLGEEDLGEFEVHPVRDVRFEIGIPDLDATSAVELTFVPRLPRGTRRVALWERGVLAERRSWPATTAALRELARSDATLVGVLSISSNVDRFAVMFTSGNRGGWDGPNAASVTLDEVALPSSGNVSPPETVRLAPPTSGVGSAVLRWGSFEHGCSQRVELFSASGASWNLPPLSRDESGSLTRMTLPEGHYVLGDTPQCVSRIHIRAGRRTRLRLPAGCIRECEFVCGVRGATPQPGWR